MEMLDEMRKLLHEKKACFLQYEEETSRIASQEYREAEEFEAGIAARQRLIEEIDGIDERMKAMKHFSPEGRRLYEISKNRWDFRTLNEEEQALFSEGQEIFRDIENTGAGARRAGRDGTGQGSSAGENQEEQHKYKIYRIFKTDGPGSEGHAL